MATKPLQPQMTRKEDQQIVDTIDKIRLGLTPLKDPRNNSIIWIQTPGFTKPYIFNHLNEQIIVWPEGDVIRLTDSIIGRGLTTTVYLATDLFQKNRYVAKHVYQKEIDIMALLKGKRGIAQIHNWAYNKFSQKMIYYGELYNSDLSQKIHSCSTDDLKIIVKDLIYSIIALEGEDSKKEWISHNDIQDRNIFLKIDHVKDQVLGAYLGDFGQASIEKTVEIDQDTLEREEELYGGPLKASRETQREKIFTSVFHQIHRQLRKKNTTLLELCKDDPNCIKIMEEMYKKYDYILEKNYFHWKD